MKILLIVGMLSGVLVVATAVVSAQELAPGAAAPAFSLIGSDGEMHSLADMKGRVVVLAWFPKAFTGG